MRTTIHEVAKAAGVSIATVSRALNGTGRVSEVTRSRVLQIARELGYQPNDVARSLLAKTTRTIAVVVPDIADPFFPELIKGIETVARDRGHLVLLCGGADDEASAWHDLAALRRRQVDGVILAGVRLAAERLQAVTAGLPVVTVDREVGPAGASVVQSDHRAGAAVATGHLLDLGHRRIAHLAGPPGLNVAEARRAGYADALTDAGVDVDTALVVAGGFLERDGYDGARELVGRGVDFTAVFAAGDLAAIGALAALEEHGLRVPADISVVGFDDIQPARYVRPRLTTMRRHIGQLGARAAELLLYQLPGAGTVPVLHETMPVELVVRESTAPPADQAANEQTRKAGGEHHR
jgi:LacI family transcriptional regulator, galactose operon repressor